MKAPADEARLAVENAGPVPTDKDRRLVDGPARDEVGGKETAQNLAASLHENGPDAAGSQEDHGVLQVNASLGIGRDLKALRVGPSPRGARGRKNPRRPRTIHDAGRRRCPPSRVQNDANKRTDGHRSKLGLDLETRIVRENRSHPDQDGIDAGT